MPLLRRALARAVLTATLSGPAAFAGDFEMAGGVREAEPVSVTIAPRLPDRVRLTVGFADLLRIEGGVSTIVLGNPDIADASPLDAGTVLLTGRAAGATNMIVLDESGAVLADLMLYVSARQPGTVTVHRALSSQVYSCATGICEGLSAEGAGGTATSNAAPALASSSQ